MRTKKEIISSDKEVKRKIGIVTATGIVVANIIGAGIFTTSGLMAAYLPGPIWVIGCWFLGGLIAIAGALSYAELATRMPEEGGEYVYLKKLYHPVFGFLTGWTSLFAGFSAPIASSALAFSAYMFTGIRTPDLDPFYLIMLKKAVAISIIFLFTLLHYVGIRWGSRIQNFLTIIKIIIVFGLAVSGMLIGRGNWANFTVSANEKFDLFGFGIALLLVMFAYSGWNASAYVAGEVKNPRKTLPLSLFAGTLIVIIIYLAVNLFLFQTTPYAELKGTITVVEAAAVRAFGTWMGNVLSLLIGIALLSSLSAFIMIGPRVYFAMARDRLFFSFAANVHPRYEVPGKSIILQGVIAIIMVMAGSFEQLILYIGFALGIFPWLAIAGLFIARKKHIGDASAVKVWGYPFVPIFYLFCGLTLLIIAFMGRPFESTAAIITVSLGIPFYYLWIKHNK